MENQDNTEQTENSFFENREINDYLIETTKWGKFLAIAGYVGMGLLILIAIIMMVAFSRLDDLSGPGAGSGFPMTLMGLLYIFIAVIYYFPINYLYKFSIRTKQGLLAGDIQTTVSGFENLKSLFKFMGIFAIVVFSIYALILLIALPVALL